MKIDKYQIGYKDSVLGGKAWAIKRGDKWDLYSSQDVFIGEAEHNGEFYRFRGKKSCPSEQRFVSFVLNTLNQELLTPKDHYVYLVFVDKYLRYIGKGNGSRFTHAISGTSHVWSLNKAYFTGSMIEVLCYADGLPSDSALNLEDSLISLWSCTDSRNLYNTKSINKQPNHSPDCTDSELFDEHCHKLLGVKVADDEEYEHVKDLVEYDFEKVYGSRGKDLNGFN